MDILSATTQWTARTCEWAAARPSETISSLVVPSTIRTYTQARARARESNRCLTRDHHNNVCAQIITIIVVNLSAGRLTLCTMSPRFVSNSASPRLSSSAVRRSEQSSRHIAAQLAPGAPLKRFIDSVDRSNSSVSAQRYRMSQSPVNAPFFFAHSKPEQREAVAENFHQNSRPHSTCLSKQN